MVNQMLYVRIIKRFDQPIDKPELVRSAVDDRIPRVIVDPTNASSPTHTNAVAHWSHVRELPRSSS